VLLIPRTLEQEPLRRRALFNKLTLIPRHMEPPQNIHHLVEFPDFIPFPSLPCNIRLEDYGFYLCKGNNRNNF